EVPRHELDDGAHADHGGADAEPGESALGDRRVDDAVGAELLEHSLRDLVGAVVLRDLFADEEDRRVASHLLLHRLTQRFADLDLGHGYFAAGAGAASVRASVRAADS